MVEIFLFLYFRKCFYIVCPQVYNPLQAVAWENDTFRISEYFPNFPNLIAKSKFLRHEVRAKLQIIFKFLEIFVGWSPQVLVGIGAPPCEGQR